ncbi:hypothetical protein [Candidatus Magnetobacterium casense]|uniref:hypothetical protein n=1 Tax=Candidatus Magnetobacterium casense TaxID=1455061 RepID=UPI0012DE52F1|nr:hypothetical protein [Candidatus Magnetobacterium casensis]
MPILLESRVDNLEMLMAEVIELCRELKIEARELKLEARELKIEAAERDRRFEEYIRQEKEERAERDRRFEEWLKKDKEEQAERDRKFEEWLKKDKEEQAERDRRFEEYIRQEKEERAERDRKFEEWLKKDKEEREQQRKAFERQMNKTSADNAQLLGTLVENIIAPGAKPLIRQYFKCEPLDFRVRASKQGGANNCEVDILIISTDSAFMIEVKSKPDGRDVKKILAKAEILPTFFSDCVGKQIIPMLASTFVDDNIIAYATRKGLHVVAYRQWEYLDILNFDAINEKNKDTR